MVMLDVKKYDGPALTSKGLSTDQLLNVAQPHHTGHFCGQHPNQYMRFIKYVQYIPNIQIWSNISYDKYYAQTPRMAHTPSMLYTWGYQKVDFTFNWEDQQGYLGNINVPPPLNFYIH